MVEITEDNVLDDDLESWLQLLIKLGFQQAHGIPLVLMLVERLDSFDNFWLNVEAFSLLAKFDDEHVQFVLKLCLQVNRLDLFHDLLEGTNHVTIDDHAHHQDKQGVQH